MMVIIIGGEEENGKCTAAKVSEGNEPGGLTSIGGGTVVKQWR